jgi:hypothetical protein
MLENMLDLGREVEGQVRELLVHPTYNPQGMSGAIQEVWVSKGDMGGPSLRQVPNVCQHDFLRHGEEASYIDRRDGTV